MNELKAGDMILQIDNLNKTFVADGGRVTALADVSLQVGRGEVVAINGRSGCGKTTLLLTAGGLLPPDTGTVGLDGRDLYALPPEQRAMERARNIGFVFQQFHLLPYLNVLENVLVPTIADAAARKYEQAETLSNVRVETSTKTEPEANEASRQGTDHSGNHDSHTRQRALALLRRFDLIERIGHRPSQLSTGEKQRVALVRALINRPKFLFADEPTGNLDDDNAAEVMRYLTDFAADGGGVLLVSHDRRTAVHADQSYQMQQGRLLT